MTSSADESETSQRTSERFQAADADVVIKSSDNVLFSLHRKYLATATGGFPPMEIEPAGETTELTEDSSTLELLFQFVYPQRHPSLSGTSYEVIASLAEAAEKYEVFAAMNVCQIRMVNFLPAHAEGIMAFAAKHGYPEIMDMAAPCIVSLPLEEIIRLLPLYYALPWVKYRQQWDDTLAFAISTQPNNIRHATCESCKVQIYCNNCRHYLQITEQLNLNLNITSLSSLDNLASNAKSQTCDTIWISRIDSWLANLKEKVDSIQKFTTFI